MRIIWSLIRYISSVLRRHYLQYRYNERTVAKLFREQGAKIGNNCIFQIRQLASEPYLMEIGNNVSIALGVTFITHDGASVIFRDEIPYLRFFGKIIVEDGCFIGSGAIITAGVRIGKGSIIGPMATVIGDVKPGSIMIGSPAIRVSTVEKYKQRCLQEWERQGLKKFEPLFEGKDKFEVQKIMMSKSFREQLRKHFQSLDISPTQEQIMEDKQKT